MRVLVAESQAKVRHALRVLLECQPGFDVVGEVVDGTALFADVKATYPDIVLLEWQLQDGPVDAFSETFGPGLLRSLREVRPDMIIIVLSGHPEEEEAALVAGADAFVSMADPPEVLLAAIAGTK